MQHTSITINLLLKARFALHVRDLTGSPPAPYEVGTTPAAVFNERHPGPGEVP